MNRRRFLMISAAAMALPARAEPVHWTGVALGADVSLTLHMPPEPAAKLIDDVRAELEQIESLFSLYRPSILTALNANGQVQTTPEFTEMLALCDQMYRATGGLFDPTVGALWQSPTAPSNLVDWSQVRWSKTSVHIAPAQSLTFNGIAQGYATDRIRDLLSARGLTRALINIGEYGAMGGPWTLGVADASSTLIDQVKLTNRAIATSSPRATMMGGRPHILHPIEQPRWNTVSVTHDSAAIADAMSTALCLASEATAREIVSNTSASAILFDGNTVLHI